jgi:hypothetical protein
MKYNKGDRLIIRTDLEIGKEYSGIEFVLEMKDFPQIVVENIVPVNLYHSPAIWCYYAGGFAWSEEMILGPALTCGKQPIGPNEYADGGNVIAMNSVTLLSAVTSYAIVTDFSPDEAKTMQAFTGMLMKRIDAERDKLEKNFRYGQK